MYYPESDIIVANHPELAKRVEVFDTYLAELQGAALQVGRTADLLDMEPELVDWLVSLYVGQRVLTRRVDEVCPSDRTLLEPDESGALYCDNCERRFGDGEADAVVSYRARRIPVSPAVVKPGRRNGREESRRRQEESEGALFIDFDLQVAKTGEEAYTVASQTQERGIVQAALDWTTLKSDAFGERLRRLRHEPFSVREPVLRQMGRALFDALFQGDVRRQFLDTFRFDVRPTDSAYLRLRLDINEDAPEVAQLPWELMYWNGMFLATQVKTLVTRQMLNLDYGDSELDIGAVKPKVLIVIPEGSGLATEAESRAIVAALGQAAIEHRVLEGRVSVNDVADAMAAGEYSILHFVGHGHVVQEADGLLHGCLRFNAPGPAAKSGSQGTAAPPGSGARLPAASDEDLVSDTRLRILLGPYASLRLVVLNACHGAEVTGNDEEGSFIGLGPALLKAGVPAVVAMQYPIKDNVAIRFAEVLYRRLTEGQWAGQIDAATSLARNACFVQYPDDRGFATPVLYLRARDGVIFRNA